MKWFFIALFVTMPISFSALADQPTAKVQMLKHDANSFSFQTGDYVVSYAKGKDSKGWIQIKRDGIDGFGIATKCANGQSFDVTDFGAGEIATYQWKHVRKDSQMFRSLACKETADMIDITIVTERQWAGFESHLIAYKNRPGLLHWKVTAKTKTDKALSGSSEPDCHFMVNNAATEWEPPVTHQVARYMVQRGPESGIVYFRDIPMNSMVFYFEDLSSLNGLYKLTRCENPYDYPVVGNGGMVKMGKAESDFQMSSPDGNNIQKPKPWTEKIESSYDSFGYYRPASVRIPAGTTVVVSDTYLYLRPATATDNITICRNFVEMLSHVYQYIYKPPMVKTDWAGEVAPKMIKDLLRPENTSVVQNKYFIPRDYVADNRDTCTIWPVLQLLEPLELYVQQYPNDKNAKELRNRLNAALPLYYDEAFKGFWNNLPPVNQNMFMQGVFILNPVIMVCDLALTGNENAKKLIEGFHDRLLKLGKNCNYVFADVWLADYSKQNSYYQMDATGAYIYIMMALYELSGGKDIACLDAAKAAAQKITDRCLDYRWEANVTAAGIVGCEKLYQATKYQRYRDILNIPLAGTLQYAWLWECDYGIGEKTTTFWAFSDMPCIAAAAEYENHRSRLHLRQYLAMAGNSLSPELKTMLTDAWKMGMTQSRSAIPPLLIRDGAKQYLAAEGQSQTNCGEIRYDQWIPLEDTRAGGWGTDLEWFQNNAKSGVIGQQIYGAGGPIWYALWQDELAQ